MYFSRILHKRTNERTNNGLTPKSLYTAPVRKRKAY